MTPSELKQLTKSENNHFFDFKTMKFFGDSMSNYGVCSNNVDGVDVWELWRKHPVKHGLQNSAFFSKENFKQIF